MTAQIVVDLVGGRRILSEPLGLEEATERLNEWAAMVTSFGVDHTTLRIDIQGDADGVIPMHNVLAVWVRDNVRPYHPRPIPSGRMES